MLDENSEYSENIIFAEQPNSFLAITPKPKRKLPKFLSVLLLVAFFSLLSGLAGGLIGSAITRDQVTALSTSETEVIYQSVIRTDYLGDNVTGLSLPDIAEIAKDSVVEITTETVSKSQRMRQFVVQGAGSGVVITSDGYIVTNNHVIDDATNINVRLASGDSFEATLIGKDSQTDLAVIKIEATNLTPAVFGNSSELKVGDLAVIIGNPLGELGGTVTDGIVSALDREITIDGETMTLLQTNAAINPGNSGGGMFNANAELVGIVNAKTSGLDIEGLGFVIPIDRAKSVISSLIENGYVSGRPGLGVELVEITDVSTAMYYRVSQLGVYVAKSQGDSDLMPGDLILKINEQSVSSSADIKTLLSNYGIGDQITILVKRGGTQQNITVTIQQEVSE